MSKTVGYLSVADNISGVKGLKAKQGVLLQAFLKLLPTGRLL